MPLEVIKQLWIQFATTYQALLGVLITAGLTFLLFRMNLRTNFFLELTAKFEKVVADGVRVLTFVTVSENKLMHRKTGLPISDNDHVALYAYANCFVQIGILYRKGFVQRELVFLHFASPLSNLVENHRELVSFLEKDVEAKDISYLYEKLRNKWHWRRWPHVQINSLRLWAIKMLSRTGKKL